VVGAELGPDRVLSALGEWRPDAALFEYWHAWSTASAIGKRGSATLLDMHDLLFQTFDRDLRRRRVPTAARSWLVRGYRRQEERAWHAFDHILAINSSERDHAAAVLGPPDRTSLVPMGVDLDLWAYAWQPPETPRFAYYGGLSSAHNQDEARRCLERVMPRIWRSLPDAELWIIGSNPPRDLLDRAASDSRVHVTGFVEEPGAVLASCSVVLCPWVGRYGFRSRIVEAMAVGVPVVATPDAVDGMALDESHGLAFGENDDELAAASVTLLDRAAALHSSQLSRRRVDELYSFAATYGKLPGIVLSTIAQKGASR
jgi:glycosyltransferase involved in cell wall biosynthesis